MALIAGKDVLLSIDIAATPTVIGYCTVNSITVNNTEVDATTKSTHPTRTLHTAASIQSYSISASGMCETADAGFQELKTVANSATPSDAFEFDDGDGETWAGNFQVSDFSWSGNHDGMAEWSATFSSTGAVTVS